MHGKFFWYDIMTSDTEAARKFYGDVIGWSAQDSGAPGTNYTVFTVEGHGVAGTDADSGRRPQSRRAAELDGIHRGRRCRRAAARLEQEGGKIMRAPCEVPGVIRFCVVADPQGAGFLIAKGLVQDAPPELAGRHARHRRLARALRRRSGRRRSTSTKRCSAGPRPMPSTWGRWEPTSCSRPAARRSAA